MLSKKLTTYKSLNLQIPSIPERSKLYSLEPIGIGTSYIESLTGYVARLAEAHCCPTGLLILSQIAPLVKEAYVFNEQDRNLDNIYRTSDSFSRSLNGTGTMASSLVQALQNLTGSNNLRYLTLLTYADILSPKGLLRPMKAWCPVCYQQWFTTGQVVYEPLIWVFNSITICPDHYLPLHTKCSQCYQTISHIAWYSRPGYCPKCRKWLGFAMEEQQVDIEVFSEEQIRWQLWVIKNVKELINTAFSLPSPPSKKNITNVLLAYKNSNTKANITAFRKFLGNDRHVVLNWFTGKTTPIFDHLLKICDYFGISLVNLINGETTCIDPNHAIKLSKKSLQRNSKSRHFVDTEDKFKITNELRAALEEYPPPSLKEVIRRIGFCDVTLIKFFPDLCEEIKVRYKDYRHKCAIEHTKKIQQQVRQAALEIHSKNLKPNSKNIGKLLNKPGLMRDKIAISTLYEVLQELGYKN